MIPDLCKRFLSACNFNPSHFFVNAGGEISIKNLPTLLFYILGLETGSTTETVQNGETVTFKVDTSTPGIQDILTQSPDTVIVPQLKRLSTVESGNINLLFDTNSFSGANYTAIATLNVTLTRPARLLMNWNTDLFNSSIDGGGFAADVRFISKIDGGFYNFMSNAPNIKRTDTASIGNSTVISELPIVGSFSTELLGAGTHTVEICAKVLATQDAPFNPAYNVGDTTLISVLQRGLDIMWY
ncbi:MAG: hypothetical protein E6R13_09150 [Spirochaetes bacterium]|nr:MAG: hypothetical protein E6R13_09150 [Spirochaetota bacterium]